MISHTQFVVIYRVKLKEKRIEILRVLHSSQAWP
ncbi:type II toxin-antitoxin system RelE/ParE family toxin [Sulfuriferula nivalis]